jgi:alpha-tubulin suppressor-like RCC1 family protein
VAPLSLASSSWLVLLAYVSRPVCLGSASGRTHLRRGPTYAYQVGVLFVTASPSTEYNAAPGDRRSSRVAMRYRLVAVALGSVALGAFLTACSSSPARSAAEQGSTTSGAVIYGWGQFGSHGSTSGPKSPTRRVPFVVGGIRGTVVQLSSSNSDSYALTSTGEVWAWGLNNDDQLGRTSPADAFTSPLQIKFPAGVRIVSLPNPMPFSTGLAIDSSGRVWGWGDNGQGELCLGKTGKVTAPVELPLDDVTLATGAGEHALYYSRNRLVACGSGASGDLGDGSDSSSSREVDVVGLPTLRVIDLTSAWEDSGALFSDGAYYDWGLNNLGQLGDGLSTDSDVPVHVRLDARARQVSLGGKDDKNGQTFAILDNDQIWAWGSNSFGQLDTGSTSNASSPVQIRPPAGVTWKLINSGGDNAYAINSDGDVWGWGDNTHGQIGIDSNTKRVIVAARITGLSGITEISGTASNVVALRT